MKIAYITTEISPAAKVGGLADVSLGLGRAIQSMGNDVFLVLPKHSCLKVKYLEDLTQIDDSFEVVFGKTKYRLGVWSAKLHGLNLFFLESLSPKSFFNRSKIYGFRDDIQRFAFFSLAAMDWIAKMHSDVDLIHINEWHSALAAPLYKEKYANKMHAKIVLTIHNLNYQGICGPTVFEKVGLSKEKSMAFSEDPKRPSKANLIKSAIHYSDYITTVSPTYYEEIQTPKFGGALSNTILNYTNKFTGILNGIDYEIWNPKIDSTLNSNYTVEELDRKKEVKSYLQNLLNMPDSHDKPLVTCICRLVPQKGIQMIKNAIDYTLKKQGQFILFGSSPIEKIQQDFNQLKDQLKSNPNIQFIFDSYNEELSHQIYAGADMLICPSLFEPCGLTQLIALQYGTVPIVRKTGGLADTVFDIEKTKKANGFTYTAPTREGIESALSRAFDLFINNEAQWRAVIQEGMNMDFSWKASAEKYFAIYSQLASKK